MLSACLGTRYSIDTDSVVGCALYMCTMLLFAVTTDLSAVPERSAYQYNHVLD
jgi:hypothetical protein